MEKLSTTIMCVLLTGGLAAHAGSLSSDGANGLSSIPLPELPVPFSDLIVTPVTNNTVRYEDPALFSRLSTTAPTPSWALNLGEKFSELEPAPFDDVPTGDESNQLGTSSTSIGSFGQGLSTGSMHEVDPIGTKTTIIPLPSAGLLGLVGIGALAAGRRRAAIA